MFAFLAGVDCQGVFGSLAAMNILLDADVLFGEQFFSDLGTVRIRPADQITTSELAWADVFICRSRVRVNAALLGGHRPFFIGTATAGMDHFDEDLLCSKGIPYTSAAGSNAKSVVDYVIASMCLWLQAAGRTLEGLSAGIVGCGHVGSDLLLRLQALGIRVSVSDPPLEAAGRQGLPFRAFEEVLAADIVSLHTSLVNTGDWPTRQLLNAAAFALIPEGSLLLSCARGEVVHDEALLDWAMRPANTAVVDVWQNEPAIDRALLKAVSVATPHIAGYSLDGRAGGTRSLRTSLLKLLGQTDKPMPEIAELAKPMPMMLLTEDSAQAVAIRAYDPRVDDRALRDCQLQPDRAAAFQQLRSSYRMRRDFDQQRIIGARGQTADALLAMGFNVSDSR